MDIGMRVDMHKMLPYSLAAVLFMSACGRLASQSATQSEPMPACPPIKHEATVSVEPHIVEVGDTLMVTCQSSGIAGLAKVRLYIGTLAAAAPDLEIYDPDMSPLVEVLPDSEVSTLGNGTFVLRALRPGSFGLYVTVYGDAFFYEDKETCLRTTHFETLYSNIVPVTIREQVPE